MSHHWHTQKLVRAMLERRIHDDRRAAIRGCIEASRERRSNVEHPQIKAQRLADNAFVSSWLERFVQARSC